MNKLFYPRPLQPGDTVALTAPSSPVPAVNLKAAIKSVKLLGLNPVVMPSCREHHGYMAGTDAQRASDLNEAFSRKDIAGIFCLRGGFGAMRLLPLLDFDMIRQNPKPLIGYSDITALHTSINKLCGFITFHGPMPNTDYSRLDDFTLDSLRSQLFRPQEICELQNPPGQELRALYPTGSGTNLSNTPNVPYAPGISGAPHAPKGNPMVTGRLTGGNLSLVAGTLGSAWEIDTKNAILFLEDVGERPYRLDRNLTALALAGKFRDCAGIILGTFTDCEEPPHDDPSDSGVIAYSTLTLQQIIEEVILPYKKPTLLNYRAGHMYPQSTLPMGAEISIDLAQKRILLYQRG